MIRFIMFLILLAVIFFIGFSMGAEQSVKHNEIPMQSIMNETNVHSLERANWNLADSSPAIESPLLVEKIAKSFEKVFFVFFEIVVELLYQITKLFF